MQAARRCRSTPWGDPDGSRYRESYFEMFPGVWRHGDWIEITDRGTAVISGRSDSTINRGGIRMGTAEIDRAALDSEEVTDALVDLPKAGTDGWMALFVMMRDGGDEIPDELRRVLARSIRERCSPRHVPDEVFVIAEVRRTRSDKVLEVPVKRILMGTDAAVAVSKGSFANPASLDYFIAMSKEVQVAA